MSIRAMHLGTFLVLFVLLVGILTSALRTARAQHVVAEREHLRFESWKLADELHQSSDDLTRLARTFVVTDDPMFEQYFLDVLAIRNGEQARPADYDGMYWDMAIVGRHTPGPGAGVALEQRMRDIGFAEEEFGRLHEAKARSDALVRMEEVAMNAMHGRFADEHGTFTVTGTPDPEMARALLHGPAYHEAKARIMAPIREFFDLVDARTAKESEVASATARSAARVTLVLSSFTTIFALVAFATLHVRTVRPARSMIGRLRDIAEGDGDLTRRVDETRRDELGELARGFNAFIGMVHDIVHRVSTMSGTVSTASTQIAAASREQSGTVRALGASTSQIAVAVREISATGGELTTTISNVTRMAEDASRAADTGRAGLCEMESNMAALADATTTASAKLAVLEERAGGIGRIMATIVKVADQTDLLSVNAAIEAETSGAAGGGFHVVAREIRHLADQTAEAALEIEQDLSEMQKASREGVTQMARVRELTCGAHATVTRVSNELSNVIEHVQGLTDQFTHVRQGMLEQAEGVRQIDGAMADLSDSAERTNASLSEFAAAAGHLTDVTSELRSEIGRFRLAEPRSAPPSV